MRAHAYIGALALLPIMAWAQQGDRLAERHAHIDALHKEEKNVQLIHAIDSQIRESEGTPWADSIHYYLHEYARAHRKLNGADAGAAAAEQILALVRERRVPRHELLALLDLSWYYYEVGRFQDCIRVDSLAVALTERHAGFTPVERGKARQYLAFDHHGMGDYASTVRYALEAIAEYEKSDTLLPMHLAESHMAVGVAYMLTGRYREANDRYMTSLEMLGESDDLDFINRRATAHGNMGVLWQDAGDLERSLRHYQENVKLFDRVVRDAELPYIRDEAILNRSRGYVNQATVYYELGDLGRAQQLLELAWSDRSSVLEPGDPQLLAVKDRMADVLLARGRYGSADSLVSLYLEACRVHYGARGENYIRAASKLGEIAHGRGQLQRADSLFQASLLAGGFGADPATDQVLYLTLHRRAQLRAETGRYEDAFTDLRRAREVMVNIHGAGHYKVAKADIAIAEVAIKAGDHTAAHDHAHAALRILEDRRMAVQRSAVPLAFPDPHLLPEAIYWSIRAERALDPEGAGVLLWNERIDQAIAAMARNRAAVRDEASKLLMVGAQKRLFDLAIDLAYEAYERSGSEADVERFLALSEADRSILLKSRLNAFAGLRFAGVPDSVLAREQELLTALDIDVEDRSTAADRGKKEKAYSAFLTRLEREHPEYFHMRYGEPAITVAGVRAALLNKQRDLVAYAVTDAHVHALVLGVDKAHILRMPRAELAEMVDAFNRAITTRDTDRYVDLAHHLHAQVFAPVAEHSDAPELLIIPDGELHRINFEALLTSPASAQNFRDHLLIRHRTIAYLLSASTAIRFAELSRHRAQGVLALAPGFTDDLKKDYLARVQDTTLIDHRFLRYVRQPFALRTAQDIGSMFTANVMLGGEATEQHFREEAARHGILHLGTHAEMNATLPMYSRLVLSKDGEGQEAEADGYLHAYEIYELDLRAQLAVLTACETGTGKHDAGEGVRSLGYGFAYAGCPSLVMSLWKIDEKVSAEIIGRFYRHLADGMPKHVALRQAKLDHLDAALDELALPYYWAGMVLVGDVEPVEVTAPWPWTVILIVAVLFIISLLLIVRMRRA